tara:strand:+ start:384 stop:605 length:222 start_codon:yes stop_codon:yes gene_type:complete
MTVKIDQIVLFNGDGTCAPSDPLWGQFRTYVLNIDDQSHRQWLNNQYQLGDVMVAHKFVSGDYNKAIVHIPTN